MERMKDLEEMLRELSEKYKNSKSVEVYEEDLEGWFKIIDDLREENKKLKERVSELEDVSKDYDTLSKDFITATGEIEFRKDEVERFKQNAMQDMKEITDLEIENKKLKSDLAFERTMLDNVRAEYKSLQNVIKNLNEKVRFLEQCLDRKEKLNKGYRKEIEKLKSTYVYDAKQVRDIC